MSTNDKNGKNKSEGFFSRIFGSKPVVPERHPSEPFPLLSLPRSQQQLQKHHVYAIHQQIRVIIWRILGFSHTKTLRLVCSLVKNDIDKFTGVSCAVDSSYVDFPFHCNIAIRKVAILDLTIPPLIEFLKHPQILEDVEVRGEVSVQNFHYIIKSCPNISNLLVIFNKFFLNHKVSLFPLPLENQNPKPLANLRSLKLVSETRKPGEMSYVHDVTIALLRNALQDAKITSLYVWQTHKSKASNVYFRKAVSNTLLFVHKHAASLKHLHLTFRDGDPAAPSFGAHVVKPGKSKRFVTEKVKAEKENQSSLHKRRNTVSIQSELHNKIEPSVPNDVNAASAPDGEGEENAIALTCTSEEVSTEDLNASTKDETQYFVSSSWPSADNLETLCLVMAAKYMKEVFKMISKNSNLRDLHLETLRVGAKASAEPNWDLYVAFVQRCSTDALKNVAFYAANHVNPAGPFLSIDLSIFGKCRKLEKLKIICPKREDFKKLTRVSGVSYLPKTLSEVLFERLLLTPWQITRLLICFHKMRSLSVSYWSISDCQFGVLMKILKWLVRLEITDVQKICLVDTKIRFQNKREETRKLQQAVSISARYQDIDETRLIIDSKESRDSKSFAPKISLQQIAVV